VSKKEFSMSETPTPALPEPDRRAMPVVTMIGAVLVFFLFVLLVVIMFGITKRFYTPVDESADRQKQMKELREADRAILTSYGKSDKGYRVPIDRAMQLVIDESKADGKKAKEGAK
jgi:hypothetical protein